MSRRISVLSKHFDCFNRTLWLVLALAFLFGQPFSWCSLSALPLSASIRSDLDSGGIRRKRAIWYVYQNERHELLPYIAGYLLLQYKITYTDPIARTGKKTIKIYDGTKASLEDELAVLHVMQSYKDSLERYLPAWISIFDEYIRKERSEAHLLKAISIVKYFRENRLIHALLRLTTDKRSSIRIATFDAIQALGNDRLIPVLVDLARHKRAVYRLYAMEALAHFPDKRLLGTVLQLLDDPSKSVRIYAILALARQPNAHSLSFNAANRFSREKSAEVRARVLETVRKNRWQNLAYLIHRGAVDSNANVRREALRTARSFQNRAAALFVSRQLSSERQSGLIQEEIYTLLRLGASGGGRGLAYVLGSHQEAAIRAQAAFALGHLRERFGISALKEALRSDPAEAVRLEAAWALGHFRSNAASKALKHACMKQSERYTVRSAAAQALLHQASFESKRSLKEIARLARPYSFAREVQSLQSQGR